MRGNQLVGLTGFRFERTNCSMKASEDEKRWVLCPQCGAKTRLQLLRQTELKAFPLFCPKCRRESIISARNFIIEAQPDAKTPC